MSLRIYNTLSKSIEEFRPLNEGEVKMYVCGPTVYDFLHIGNFRGPIFFNVVRNWLERQGYKVTYVFNYTDVDDKIINRAKHEGVEASEISEEYIAEFEKDFNSLGLRAHDHNPRVTEFLPQIIDFVSDLVAKDVAYVIDGEVFFSIDKFDTYGKLSGKKLEDLVAGQRVEVDSRKKSPADFVLWKPAKEGEPYWTSPWGKGRPGWHIECSAMIQSILGESIDIHGGGIDLIFPHHENEIAQGEGRTCKHYSKYWMHNNFINLDNEKMSKSLGNIIKCRDFVGNYSAEIFKYVMLSAHYRTHMNIDDTKVFDSMAALHRIHSALLNAKEIGSTDNGVVNPKLNELMEKQTKEIENAFNDDFNTPKVLACIFEVVRAFNALNLNKKKITDDSKATAMRFQSWLKDQGIILSLFEEPSKVVLDRIQEVLVRMKKIDTQTVEALVAKRLKAREEKDWGKADQIRDELAALGIELQDGGAGKSWSVKIGD